VVEKALDDDLITSAGVVTGRYATWNSDHGVPIRTTVGTPRFWRHGPLVFIKELAPFGIFGQGLPVDVARTRYRDRLEAKADQFVAALADVARQHRGERLCVLCFEDVHAGQDCHRRWFAEWFQQRFGMEVPEVMDVDRPGATDVDNRQLRLQL
jgi:hypothetical protein